MGKVRNSAHKVSNMMKGCCDLLLLTLHTKSSRDLEKIEQLITGVHKFLKSI